MLKILKKRVFVGAFVFALAVFAFSAEKAEAVAISSTTTGGAFADGGTWVGGVVPGAADDITIVAGATVTVADDTTDTTGSITIEEGATFTVSGTLTVTDPATVTNSGTVNVATSLTGTGTFINEATGVLNIGGAIDITTLTATAVGNTVNYTGTAPTCKVTTYDNLSFTGTGANTVTCAATTVTGDLTTSGTANWTLSAALAVGGDLTVGSGTTITTAGFALTVTGTTGISGTVTLTNNTGAKTFTGLVTVNSGGSLNGASTNIITSAGIANAGTVAITGTNTISTAGATFSGANAISISTLTVTAPGTVANNGTLTVGTALGGNGALTNTGTLNLGGTTTITTLTATASGNTVNYNLAGNQTLKATAYRNLTLSGGGAAVKTISSAITVSGTLTVATATSMDLTGDSTANLMKFNDSYKKSGSWGFTDSAATNKDTTFITAGTGIITVTGAGPGTISSSSGSSSGSSSNNDDEEDTADEDTTDKEDTKAENKYEGCSAGMNYSITTGKSCAGYVAPDVSSFKGCDGRNVGYSVTTGKTCVGNPSASQGQGNAYAFGTVLVKLGVRGDACSIWQSFLNAKANGNLVVDGICGPKTMEVAKKWQSANGLVADGLLGPASRAKALTQ